MKRTLATVVVTFFAMCFGMYVAHLETMSLSDSIVSGLIGFLAVTASRVESRS